MDDLVDEPATVDTAEDIEVADVLDLAEQPLVNADDERAVPVAPMPRGPDEWGQRFVGKAAVREGLAGRLEGLPDVHYGEDRHWGSGNMVASEWLLTGTRPGGEKVKVRGCDHYEFRDGKVIRRDSFWKIVEWRRAGVRNDASLCSSK
jgi:ketosteroid isomerase-like protein